MKFPATHHGRRPAVRTSKTRRSSVMKLALAVALAVPVLAFLVRPATGYGSAALTVSVSDAPPVTEGNPSPSPTPAATFTISLSAANPGPTPVSVNYGTTSGTAQSGSDFQSTNGTATFAMGDQTMTVSVPIIPDTQLEGDENFFVNLSSPQGGVTIADGQGEGVIVDDEPGGSLQFSQSAFEVGEKDGTATITVVRTGSKVGTITVNYTTFNTNVATPGQDYGNAAGTLTFAPGETTKTFEVPILDDTLAEVDETLGLQLSGPTGGAVVISPSTATLTILDDDISSEIFAVTSSNKLIRFRSESPETVTVVGTITGLQTGEDVVGIDFRPANGQLYALGKFGGAGRLYTINTTTAAATLVAPLTVDPTDTTSPSAALNGTAFGIDFNPVADRLRVVSDAEQNIRINPANGRVITDDNLAYISGDQNFGSNPNITDAAYSNSFAGATETTLYDIDSGFDIVATQDPPNSGQLRTQTTLAQNTTEVTGFDIRGSDNSFFASLTAPGDSVSRLAFLPFSRFGQYFASDLGPIGGGELVRDIAVAPAGTFQFSAATATVGEGAGKASLTLTRTGDTTVAASIEVATADGTATQKGDYTIARTTVKFAPGEASKTVEVFIVDDAFDEADETFTVSLRNPTANFAPGTNNPITVTITDNDDVNGANPIDNTTFFVRQHYLDFLNREPDASGLAFWVNGIESCGADAGCRDAKRINTSAAFFLSIEFQETGFYAIRVQRAAFFKESEDEDTRVTYEQLIRDARQVGDGVIIGQPGAEARLNQNKTAYALRIVNSPEFIAIFPTNLSATNYVNRFINNNRVFLTDAERQSAIDAFGSGGPTGRAAALRSVADSVTARQMTFRPAFVLMQYFGYLRRNPTDLPDMDDGGYQFWLAKLNSFNGDFQKAEMVRAFILSDEYRKRFGN
jgi:hypothetical protein